VCAVPSMFRSLEVPGARARLAPPHVAAQTCRHWLRRLATVWGFGQAASTVARVSAALRGPCARLCELRDQRLVTC
jgi:hypothetical protein